VDETVDGGGAGFDLAGIRSAVAEGDLGGFQAAVVAEGEQAAVGEGDAEDVGSQVFESSLSVADWLAMDDPILLPDFSRHLGQEWRLFQVVVEFCSEQLGKRLDWNEEVVMGGQPGLPVRSQGTTGDQVVDMGVISQVAGPGMEYAQHPDLSAEMARVLSECLCGFRRSLEEQVVVELLVAAGGLAQSLRESEGEQEVRGWQEPFLLQC